MLQGWSKVNSQLYMRGKYPLVSNAFIFDANPLLWGGGERVLRVLVVLDDCTVLIRGWEKHSLEEFGESCLSFDRQVCP